MADNRTKIGKVIARAWTDADFRKRLHSHPADVLKEAGIDVPAGRTIHVVDETEDKAYFVIPTRPSHISVESLKTEQVHADICKPCLI